jgi:hypothetical protein
VRYYLEQRDPSSSPRWLRSFVSTGKWRYCGRKGRRAEVKTAAASPLVSYDEKPGIQAIGTTAPDRMPCGGASAP